MRPLVRALLPVLTSSLPADIAPGDEAASPATHYVTAHVVAGDVSNFPTDEVGDRPV